MEYLEQFREEVRNWLEENCPPSMRTPLVPEEEVWGGRNAEYVNPEFGMAGISVIMQELGKTLTPSPILSTSVLGVSAINMLGSDEQKESYLPKIVAGELTMALAIDEGNHHDPFAVEATAVLDGDKWVLNGKKVFVVDGASADTILIVARTSGKSGESNGISVFAANNDSAGLDITKIATADSRNYANIEMSDLKLEQNALLGEQDLAGLVLTPSVVISISRKLIPLCFGSFGPVLTRAKIQSALSAYEVHTF